jgi:alpha-galactosidase
MLVIGLNGKGASASANGASGCSVTEYEAQFGLWALLSAPLLMTCDIRDMDADTKRILTNKEIIAVNQDKKGVQARRIFKESCKELWAKKLADGSYAVGFLNRHDNETIEITLDLDLIGLKDAAARDLWKHEDIGEFKEQITLKVRPHECRMLKIKKM